MKKEFETLEKKLVRVVNRLEKQSALAEDIISEVLADEEMRRRQALEKKVFYSLRLLNKCRKFFGQKPVKLMNPKGFTESL